MPGQPQQAILPFTGGLDTKTDAFVLQPPSFSRLENVVFKNPGSLRPRVGSMPLSLTEVGGNDLDDGLGLFSRGTELLCRSDKELFSYDERNETWREQATFSHVTPKVDRPISLPGEVESSARVSKDGIVWILWERPAASDIYLTVMDEDTGYIYLSELQISANGEKPLAGLVEGEARGFYVDNSTDEVKMLLFLSGNPTNTPTEVVLVDDLDTTNYPYDVSFRDAGTLSLFYLRTGTFQAVLRVFDASGVELLDKDLSGATPGAGFREGITGDYQGTVTVVVAFGTGGSVGYAFSASFIGAIPWAWDTVATDTKRASLLLMEGGDNVIVQVAREIAGTPSYVRVTWHKIATPGGLITSVEYQHAKLGSGFLNFDYPPNGDTTFPQRTYFTLAYDSPTGLQDTFFLVESNRVTASAVLAAALDINVIGRLFYGTANRSTADYAPLARPQKMSDTQFSWAAGFKRELDALDTEAFTHPGIMDVDFLLDRPVRSAEYGQAVYFNGGSLWHYDGDETTEAGFWLFPEMQDSDFTPSNGAGALTSSASYRYRVYYCYENRRGERFISTAVQKTVTLGAADDTVDITIPTLGQYTRRADDTVRVLVYRTTANAPGQAVFYLVSSWDPTDTAYVVDDTDAATTSFTDLLADTTIISNEIDYVRGSNQLDHVAPPSAEFLASSQLRVFLAGGEIPQNEVWVSKERTQGRGLEFSDFLRVQVPEAGGRITALATLNEALVVFKEDRIYLVPGRGPTNQGLGDFGLPIEVNTSVGCKNHDSIARIPGGLVFQSDKGFWLLNQSMQVSYIGAQAEKFNDIEVAKAVVLHDRNLALFIATGSSPSNTLAYDYQFGHWCVFTNYRGVDAVVVDDDLYRLTLDNRVLKRDEAAYTDGGTAYSLVAETGFTSLTGLLGWNRLRWITVLGRYRGTHDLRVEIAYDEDPVFSQLETFDADSVIDPTTWGDEATWGGADVWGGSGEPLTDAFRFRAAVQKASRFRFRITAKPDTSPGESVDLVGMQLELRAKGGVRRFGGPRTLG